MEQAFYELVPTRFGAVGIVWWDSARGPRVRHVFLSRERRPSEQDIREHYPDARQRPSPVIDRLGAHVQRFLEGQPVVFDVELVALEVCGAFQRRVLLAEYGIPRGWVSTYGRIAKHVGVAGGSRAVGRALAENPFPIIIPCQRAVRADGEIGGYQGGSGMKRALLALEGVDFTAKGKVLLERLHY